MTGTRSIRWAAAATLLALTVLGGCADEQDPLPQPDQPAKTAADNGDEKSGPEPIEQPFITPLYALDQPVRIGLAVVDGDPETTRQLGAALAKRWGTLVQVRKVSLGGAAGAELLGATDEKLGLRLDESSRDIDRLVVLAAAATGRGVRIREWTRDLSVLSCTFEDDSASLADKHELIDGIEQMISWSARVIDVEGNSIRLALRGSGLLVGRNPPVRVGDFGQVDYHRPGQTDRFQRVRGSFGRITKIVTTATGTEIEVKTAGWYRPKVGDRWRRLFLPGGNRTIRVVNSSGKPQAGFVVYAHGESFSKKHDDCAGVTDTQGAVSLKAAEGQVAYVQIVSTVQGIDFVFFQGVVPVARGLAPWDVQVADMKTLASQAAEVSKRLLSGEQMNVLRGKIKALLDASALLVRNARFPEAIENLENALKLLSGVQNTDATGLRGTVARLKKKYEENNERQKLIDSRTEVYKNLAQADQAVYAGRFEEGRELLQKAKARWPSDMFPERAKLIARKLTQAKRLVKEEHTAVGQTRAELLRGVDKMTADTLSMDQVSELERKIEVINRDGVHDPDVIYSDSELLSRLKLKLDRASQSMVAEIKRLRAQYEASEDVAERTEIYQKEQRLSSFREALDKLLQKLINARPPNKEPK